MNSENPTCVLFDMDGVLLDTEPLYSQAIHSVTTRFGHDFTWALKEKIMGRGRMAAARFLVETLQIPLTPEAFLAERDVVLMDLLAVAKEIPGAEAFTRLLHARGVKMAVATSSESGIFEHKTGLHREWFSIFSAVVCGDDPRLTAAKPSPDIFLVAARELGVKPDHCLVVEDSPAGVQAARAAGMRVIAMPDPNLDPSLVAMADCVIRGFHEFPMECLEPRI
jgi:pseudouridine 5'-phosphatase